MKLEEQVVSLELSKQLKSLGVKQESLFYWEEARGMWFIDYSSSPGVNHISAFTGAELGEMWPFGKDVYTFKTPISGTWIVEYEKLNKSFVGSDEVEARAKMLIYLLENKFITL